VEEDKPKANLLSQLGIAQARLGKNKLALKTWRKAIAIYTELKDYDQAAYLYARSGRTFFDAGDTPGNLSICEEGLEALKDAPASRGMAFLAGEHARALLFNLQMEEGLKVSEKAFKMAEKFGVVEVQVDMLNNMGAWGDNTIEEARQKFHRAIELAEGDNLWREAARAHNNFFIALSVVNCDFQNAYNHLQRAIELSRLAGAVDNEFFYLNNVETFLGITCDFQAFEEVLERMGQLVEAMPDSEGSMRTLAQNEAILRYARDRDLHQVVEKFREDLDYFRELKNYQAITDIGVNLANYLMQIEEYEEGEKILRETIPLAEQSVNPANLPSKCLLSGVLSRMGKVEAAREVYENAFREHNEGKIKSKSYVHFLNHTEANLLIAEGKWEPAWEVFEQLNNSLAKVGDLPYQEIILIEWAKAHLLRGEEADKQRARELFGEAIKISEKLGATGWVEYVQEEIEKIQ
jgi:tetratricopeptide (TPR) repeat protein